MSGDKYRDPSFWTFMTCRLEFRIVFHFYPSVRQIGYNFVSSSPDFSFAKFATVHRHFVTHILLNCEAPYESLFFFAECFSEHCINVSSIMKAENAEKKRKM